MAAKYGYTCLEGGAKEQGVQGQSQPHRATWDPVSKEKKEERKKEGRLKKGLKAKEIMTLPS